MTNETQPSALQALAEKARTGGGDAAPVHLWDPAISGEIDMRIAEDGRWFHEGRPIERMALVRLFASILKVDEDGETYLVTPVEKLRIQVDDTHFLAVEAERGFAENGQIIVFRTNLGDLVRAGRDHPIVLPRDPGAAFRPSLVMRHGLRAGLTRATALELAEWLEEDEAGYFLTSDGVRFRGPPVESGDD